MRLASTEKRMRQTIDALGIMGSVSGSTGDVGGGKVVVGWGIILTTPRLTQSPLKQAGLTAGRKN
jgi:hypothetical protein